MIPYYVNAAAKEVFNAWPTDKNRHKDVVEARRATIAYLKTTLFPSMTTTKIGTIIGDKNHATILHHIKTHYNLYKTDGFYRMLYDRFFKICEVSRKSELQKTIPLIFCKQYPIAIVKTKKAGYYEPTFLL